MARYVPKSPPFLSPQMLAMGPVLSGYADGIAAGVPSIYSAVTKGKYKYKIVKEAGSTSFGGGPRAYVSVGVQGPFALAMEFGSEHFPRSGLSRGALRRGV